MPKIVIPKTEKEIKRQIEAINYAMQFDMTDKCKAIHREALRQLEEALKEVKK